MKNGFTLVEISIVLVVIGLLICGMLVGQSLVGAAKIQRIVSDLQKYEISVMNFRTKYGVYPGDAPGFTPPGNADGELAVSNGDSCAGGPGDWTIYSSDERTQVWAHLSQAKMLNKQYPAFAPQTCGGTHENPGPLAPATELDERASIFSPVYHPIMVHKASGGNFAMDFYLNAHQAIPVENKLGVTDYDRDNPDPSIESAVGLVNRFGAEDCFSVPIDSFLPCNDPEADVGYFSYFVMPN